MASDNSVQAIKFSNDNVRSVGSKIKFMVALKTAVNFNQSLAYKSFLRLKHSYISIFVALKIA